MAHRIALDPALLDVAQYLVDWYEDDWLHATYEGARMPTRLPHLDRTGRALVVPRAQALALLEFFETFRTELVDVLSLPGSAAIDPETARRRVLALGAALAVTVLLRHPAAA